MTGIVLGMPEDTYHAHSALSSTQAKLLLDSPAMYDWVVTQGHRTEKAAFDLGSAIHAEVLGSGYDVVELDFDDFRSAAARTARDEVRAAGKIPMLRKDMTEVHATAQAVLAHPRGRALLEREGDAEASVFATDPATGVQMRCRFDFLPADRRVAVDLKTARKGHAKVHKFASSIVEYGYDVSWAWYTRTAELAREAVTDLVFLVVETEPPYHLAVYRLNDEFKEIGEAKALRAREIFARCTETGEWPGLPTDIQVIRPPQYAIYQHIDDMETSS
ncbi:PD-(D/E)XK nuclease-like domain-containing protein [Microbacterium sp. No. 7]|uniref:PD-(D/E)XK nuclease-like domain-containing protein n=1 Tax=Microbacterium sp. No. 7 TaxID=1714373 RepID=UPI0006D1B524|nr:PD-(D/E)XK nuclease-like domain-containing protein [Microbacterium sp. No. 7]ALJ22086.1 hypothetical protein AOA12_20210 [Microbacterium sp. No. 7]